MLFQISRRFKSWISCGVVLLSLAGCAKNESHPPIKEMVARPKPPHDDYFMKYCFKDVPASGDSPESYSYLAGKLTPIATTGANDVLVAEVYVFLNPDHQYQFFYREMTLVQNPDYESTPGPDTFKEIDGQWSADGDVLKLDGLGVITKEENVNVVSVADLMIPKGQLDSQVSTLVTPLFFGQTTWAPMKEMITSMEE